MSEIEDMKNAARQIKKITDDKIKKVDQAVEQILQDRREQTGKPYRQPGQSP